MSSLYVAASRGLELQLPATLFGNFSELFRQLYPAHMVAWAAGIHFREARFWVARFVCRLYF